MTKTLHHIYVSTMVLIVVAVTIYIGYTGASYYGLPIEERFYHERYDWFKPSGLFGQGLGVVGTALILFGVSIYILHKRYNILGNKIRLKYLLEFHIFLCTLGPILILYHTTFKFGGIVSVAFWSMVAVVASGVIGRFIYIQIPRTIEGRELSLQEVQKMKDEAEERVDEMAGENRGEIRQILQEKRNNILKREGYFVPRRMLADFRKEAEIQGMNPQAAAALTDGLREEWILTRRIGRLEKMKQFFKYWHVAHMPFALIMLIIVTIHVVVTVSMGYKWLF